MCKVGTSEVVEEDPFATTRYAFDEEDRDDSYHDEEDSMTACINICRLIPNNVPTCIGFLMSAPGGSGFVRCVPLFEGTATSIVEYQPEAGDRVFNIEGCIE